MTVATKLKKATFKHIESELYSYHDTLKEINNLRKDIMFTKENDDENIGGGRSSFISSPTEQIATRLATHKRLGQLEEVTTCYSEGIHRLTRGLSKVGEVEVLDTTADVNMGWNSGILACESSNSYEMERYSHLCSSGRIRVEINTRPKV
jgi:hypothetical protein